MLKGARGRKGFTLIETVVTVGIIATLAAVVVPQVVRQFDSADPTRIQNDLKNLQAAIETFNVNVRALPGDLEDLANATTAADDSTLTTAATISAFSSGEVGLWKGPYFDQSIVLNADTDDLISTGYGASITDSFVCYASGNNQTGVSEGTAAAGATDDAACPGTGTGQQFLAVQITGIACSTTAGSTFMTINEMFDGASEATADQAGRIRCRAAAGTNKVNDVAVVYFLAVPIT